MSLLNSSNLPLPPNWEARLDSNTQKWYFIDHEHKTTTWNDPRPAYYLASKRSSEDSVFRHNMTSERSSESSRETPNVAVRSTSQKNASSPDPESSMDPEIVEEYMEHLKLLRSVYPEYKSRQLAKVFERVHGDSTSVRQFIACYLTPKPRASSGRRGSAQIAEIKPSLSHDLMLDDKSPDAYETIHSPIRTEHDEIPSTMASPTRPRRKSSHRSGSITEDSIQEEPVKSPKPRASLSDHVEENEEHEYSKFTYVSPATKSVECDTTKQDTKVRQPITIEHNSSSRVCRVQAMGPDKTLLGPRLIPKGPDANLVRGPNPNLVTGPSRQKLSSCSS